MGKLRQNSEVTCPRSCNLSVAKPGMYFQKSRFPDLCPIKVPPYYHKASNTCNFFPPTAAVVLVTQRKWMIFPDWIPAFFGKKHLVLSKCCIMLFAEAFLLRNNRKKDGFPMAGRLYRSKQSRVLFLAEDLLLGILHTLLLLQVLLPRMFAGDEFHMFWGEPASLPVWKFYSFHPSCGVGESTTWGKIVKDFFILPQKPPPTRP